MPVRDFISENGITGQKPNHNARKLAAEMARVTVPPTRLSAPLSSSALHQNDDDQGDMFDTDLEGIDDTTTITGSMIDDGVAIVNPRPQRFREFSLPVSVPQQHEANRHETFAERMAREYEGQQQDRNEQYELDYHQEDQQQIAPPHNHEQEEFDDPEVARLLAWEDTMELDRQPRTWQQIEAALRQGPQQPVQRDENDLYEPHILHDSSTARRTTMPEPQRPHVHAHLKPITRPSTAYPASKPLSHTRLANSRFSSPNTPFPAVPASVTDSRENLRPASVAGRPQSPPDGAVANLQLVQRDELPNQHQHQQQHQQQQQQQHQQQLQVPGSRETGIFDTTNLSAVNSSESSDRHTMYTSVRLSTLSPASSSKRGSTDAFESDYAPNVLKSKTFAELEAESFDYIPTPMQPVFPPQRQPLSLHEQLDRLRSLTEGQRRTFFSSLTLTEWEDSGDWLIEQFQELLKKTKDARRERRKVAQVFEKEIARRYASVEEESQGLKNRMNEMKTGGLGVLRGQRQP